jgi:hypothetical protein
MILCHLQLSSLYALSTLELSLENGCHEEIFQISNQIGYCTQETLRSTNGFELSIQLNGHC